MLARLTAANTLQAKTRGIKNGTDDGRSSGDGPYHPTGEQREQSLHQQYSNPPNINIR